MHHEPTEPGALFSNGPEVRELVNDCRLLDDDTLLEVITAFDQRTRMLTLVGLTTPMLMLGAVVALVVAGALPAVAFFAPIPATVAGLWIARAVALRSTASRLRLTTRCVLDVERATAAALRQVPTSERNAETLIDAQRSLPHVKAEIMRP